MDNNASDLNKLTLEVRELNTKIDKLNSFSRRFLLSIVTGLGTAIGAIVIFGALLAIISNTIDRASDLPFVGKYFDEVEIG